MLDLKEVQCVLKLMDAATVKGLEANQMMVGIAIKLSKFQQQLSAEALSELQQPGKKPELKAVETPEEDVVVANEPSKEVVQE